MALITCEDCKNEMSDKASACPKCGWNPVPTEAKRAQAEENQPPYVLVGLVLGGVGALLFFTGTAGFYGVMGGMLGMLGGGVMFGIGMLTKPK